MNGLLIARNRGFWKTKICARIFLHRITLSDNSKLFEQFWGAIKGLYIIFRFSPEIVVMGTSTKIVSIYAFLRRLGFLRKIKIITDKQYLKDRDVRVLDRIIVYSPQEVEQYESPLRSKFTTSFF